MLVGPSLYVERNHQLFVYHFIHGSEDCHSEHALCGDSQDGWFVFPQWALGLQMPPDLSHCTLAQKQTRHSWPTYFSSDYGSGIRMAACPKHQAVWLKSPHSKAARLTAPASAFRSRHNALKTITQRLGRMIAETKGKKPIWRKPHWEAGCYKAILYKRLTEASREKGFASFNCHLYEKDRCQCQAIKASVLENPRQVLEAQPRGWPDEPGEEETSSRSPSCLLHLLTGWWPSQDQASAIRTCSICMTIALAQQLTRVGGEEEGEDTWVRRGQPAKKKQRAQVIEFFIDVARECFNIGNFNSLMAIISGMNMSPVSRLKKTWGKAKTAKFFILEHQMDPTGNFYNYRTALRGAAHRSRTANSNRERIVIPFFSLLIKDIYFLNEGCANRLPNGHVNFEKFVELARQVGEFMTWKQVECPFEEDRAILHYLHTAPIFSEDGLYLASYESESPENQVEKDRWKALRSNVLGKT
ncbi:ras-GEF domain-containing family member 1C-like isoform X1 [Lates japonicus]|uniref:Ras-GEF domain-containing family member 1C-like isoform X1 n=1 Tax=Lates japonicus TaxID=270547 RepID=A0AAD3ND12_LATJO|nr:ras-GEF domain-containing family member 1C-like isoform X1 [Lates japonicus]